MDNMTIHNIAVIHYRMIKWWDMARSIKGPPDPWRV